MSNELKALLLTASLLFIVASILLLNPLMFLSITLGFVFIMLVYKIYQCILLHLKGY